MKPRLIQIALIGLLFEGQSYAQVVSVECCISEGSLTRIGQCLSGPDNTTFPPSCGSIGTCVLGFDADTALASEMCDPAQPEIPDELRAVCRSWVAQEASVTQECVASPNTDFSHFEMYDADRDGDLDLRDMAVFQEVYRLLPLRTPSRARLVSVECCISEGNLTRIGECLSGPDNTNIPQTCGSIGTCVLGFDTNTTLLPDMCDLRQPDIPDEPRAVCKSWVVPESVVAQECVASPHMDFNLFEMHDADSDGDMDLRDMAVFQEGYRSLPTKAQSDARLVFVECCVPAADPRAVCTLGFSGVVEPGDFLYELCSPKPETKASAAGATCYSWSAGYVPVAYLCEARDVCEYRCPAESDGDTGGVGCFADFAGFDGSLEAGLRE